LPRKNSLHSLNEFIRHRLNEQAPFFFEEGYARPFINLELVPTAPGITTWPFVLTVAYSIPMVDQLTRSIGKSKSCVRPERGIVAG
jgi:hypothetical protein